MIELAFVSLVWLTGIAFVLALVAIPLYVIGTVI
jgi:hypothetical protein